MGFVAIKKEYAPAVLAELEGLTDACAKRLDEIPEDKVMVEATIGEFLPSEPCRGLNRNPLYGKTVRVYRDGSSYINIYDNNVSADNDLSTFMTELSAYVQ